MADRRRRRLVLSVGVLAVLVLVLAVGFTRALRVVDDDPAQGPLQGTTDAGAQMPVPAGATAVAFGIQVLSNTDDQQRDIVLRSVTVRGAHGGLTPLGVPYVFDDRRAQTAGAGQLVTATVPLPDGWREVPRRPVAGYVLRPAARLSAEGTGDAEVVLEFAVPPRVAWLEGVNVEYDLGGERHSVTFNSTLVVCPPGTREEACPERPPNGSAADTSD